MPSLNIGNKELTIKINRMKTCKEALTENDIIDMIVTLETLVEDCDNDNDPINGFEWSWNAKQTIKQAEKLLAKIDKKRG